MGVVWKKDTSYTCWRQDCNIRGHVITFEGPRPDLDLVDFLRAGDVGNVEGGEAGKVLGQVLVVAQLLALGGARMSGRVRSR